jgi:hypothetical protein
MKARYILNSFFDGVTHFWACTSHANTSPVIILHLNTAKLLGPMNLYFGKMKYRRIAVTHNIIDHFRISLIIAILLLLLVILSRPNDQHEARRLFAVALNAVVG